MPEGGGAEEVGEVAEVLGEGGKLLGERGELGGKTLRAVLPLIIYLSY